jgi:hypothetical protein
MAIQEAFAFLPFPPVVIELALEPIEITMWEASPPSGLRCVPSEWHPEPMSTSVRFPKPSSSRTARQRVPSAFLVKVTPLTGLTRVLPSSLRTSSLS